MIRKAGILVLSTVLGLIVFTRLAAQGPSKKVKDFLGEPTLTVFAGASKVECFRIEPSTKGDVTDKNHIAGYKIIRKGKDQDEDFAKRLVAVLEDEKSLFGTQNRCFIPHHAFRIWKEKTSVDVIICLTCDNLHLITRDESGKPIKSGQAKEDAGIPYVVGRFGGNERKVAEIVKEVLPEVDTTRHGVPHRLKSIPDELEIVQQGKRPGHHELRPKIEMPVELF